MPTQFETGIKQVHIAGTDGQVPMQESSRYLPQDKVATSVNVNAGITATIATVEMTGYTTMGLQIFASLSHAFTHTVWSSPDGSKTCGQLNTVTATNQGRNALINCPGDFALVEVTNSDAVARTYDVWARKINS